MKHVFLIASALAAVAAVPATAQTFVTGDATVTGLGSDQTAYPGTPFDTLTLSSSGDNYTGPGTYNFNNVTFTTGINSNTATTFGGVLTLSGLFAGSQAFTYNVNYSGTIGASDTITVGGNYVNILGQGVHFNPLTLTSAGEVVTGVLTGTVGGVPEPTTWALMIVGFGAVGGAMRRRSAVRTSVRYA